MQPPTMAQRYPEWARSRGAAGTSEPLGTTVSGIAQGLPTPVKQGIAAAAGSKLNPAKRDPNGNPIATPEQQKAAQDAAKKTADAAAKENANPTAITPNSTAPTGAAAVDAFTKASHGEGQWPVFVRRADMKSEFPLSGDDWIDQTMRASGYDIYNPVTDMYSRSGAQPGTGTAATSGSAVRNWEYGWNVQPGEVALNTPGWLPTNYKEPYGYAKQRKSDKRGSGTGEMGANGYTEGNTDWRLSTG
jgi:hypothetical protein